MPLILAACATPVQHNTPSKKAEVTIHGVTRAQVRDFLTDGFATACPNLVKSEESQIVCEGPVTDSAAYVALYTRYDSDPIYRVTLNLIKVKGGVRVVSNYAGISNPGSAYERRNDWNNSPDTLKLQDALNKAKSKLEGNKK